MCFEASQLLIAIGSKHASGVSMDRQGVTLQELVDDQERMDAFMGRMSGQSFNLVHLGTTLFEVTTSNGAHASLDDEC